MLFFFRYFIPFWLKCPSVMGVVCKTYPVEHIRSVNSFAKKQDMYLWVFWTVIQFICLLESYLLT